VRKHLKTLLEDELTYVTPKLGSLAGAGELVYHLTVTGKVSVGQLRLTLGDGVLVSETDEPPLKYLLWGKRPTVRFMDAADIISESADADFHSSL